MRKNLASLAWLVVVVLTITGSLTSFGQEGFKDVLGGVKPSKKPPLPQPADLRMTLKPGKSREIVQLEIVAKTPEESWIYAFKPKSGPDTSVEYDSLTGLEKVEPELIPDHEPKEVFVPVFAVGGETGNVEKHIGGVTWTQEFRVIPGSTKVAIQGKIRYQVCDKHDCKLGKATIDVSLDLNPAPSAPATPRAVKKATPTLEEFADLVPNKLPDGSRHVQLNVKDPVSHWSVIATTQQLRAGDSFFVVISAEMADLWKIYAFNQGLNPKGEGPNRTVAMFEESAGIVSVDPQFFGEKPHEEPDPGFDDLIDRTLKGKQVFFREMKVAPTASVGPVVLRGSIGWQICKHVCIDGGFSFELPLEVVADPIDKPSIAVAQIKSWSRAELEDKGEILKTQPRVQFATKEEFLMAQARTEPPTPQPATSRNSQPNPKNEQPKPIEKIPEEPAAAVDAGTFDALTSQGLPYFLLTAILAGYAALITPCVFPMVPITVSFFQKQAEKEHHSPLIMACVYCLGIIGTFTILGLALSAIFGATSLNQLANNGWLNLAISVVLIFFAFNLLGMFEITIPSWMLSFSSSRELKGGYIGVLFMSLTFTLTSFTCTFGFVGLLISASAAGSRLWPLIGLLAFSTAFASPFFFLALFPSWLKKLPRAGGWMNSSKVIMGLLELALVFKFLSVADFSWNPVPAVFDHELVMSSWIVIAVACALYLLGLFRLPHDVPTEHIGVGRFILALSFLGLGTYLGVGLFGSQKPTSNIWKTIATFAPPRFAGEVEELSIGFAVAEGGITYSYDVAAAIDAARSLNKPVFMDFTGVNCMNCRMMESGPLSSPEAKALLKEFICIKVWVDQIPKISDSAIRDRLLAQNLDWQEWYGNYSLPSYIVIRPDVPLRDRQPREGILSEFVGYNPSNTAFVNFLDKGLKSFRGQSGKQLADKN